MVSKDSLGDDFTRCADYLEHVVAECEECSTPRKVSRKFVEHGFLKEAEFAALVARKTEKAKKYVQEKEEEEPKDIAEPIRASNWVDRLVAILGELNDICPGLYKEVVIQVGRDGGRRWMRLGAETEFSNCSGPVDAGMEEEAVLNYMLRPLLQHKDKCLSSLDRINRMLES